MKRFIPIGLIIFLCFGFSSVYATNADDVYTPEDFAYTVNQYQLSTFWDSSVFVDAVVINDYDELSSFCSSLGVPLYYNGDTDLVLYSFSYDDDGDYISYYANPSTVQGCAFRLYNSSGSYSYAYPKVPLNDDPSTTRAYRAYPNRYGNPTFDNSAFSNNASRSCDHWVFTARFRFLGSDISNYNDILHVPIETVNGGLVSLQSGNALVIDTLGGDVSQIGLFTTLPVKSSVFSDFRSGASYFVTNDLNSIKFVDFNTHAFTWNKQEGTTGILGQTDKGVYTINNPSGGRYIVIVNPRYMPRGSDHFLTNNPITVAISGTYRNLFRFSLTQSNATLVTLSDDGESLIQTEQGGTNNFGGSVTFDDIPDTDPLPSDTPVIAWGTGNTPDYSEVPSLDGSVIGQATENLQGIRSDFNGFFGVIRDCISWLPPQLITLLVAAMSLLVAVGIVKALL